MPRVTVVHEGRTFRASLEVAENYVRQGATVDASDEAGAEAWNSYVQGRDLPEAAKPRKKGGRRTRRSGTPPKTPQEE